MTQPAVGPDLGDIAETVSLLPDLDADDVRETDNAEPVPGAVQLFPGTGSASMETLDDAAQVSFPEAVSRAVSHWAGNGRNAVVAAWTQPGGPWRGGWYGHPESLAEHWAYVARGDWATGPLTRYAGGIQHLFVGFPLHLLGDWIGLCGRRPMVFYGSLALIGVIVLIVKIAL